MAEYRHLFYFENYSHIVTFVDDNYNICEKLPIGR